MSASRSIILNGIVPESVMDEKVFVEALEMLKDTRVETIEYYTPFELAKERNRIMKDMGFRKSIYLIAGRQKGERLSLCNPDENGRQAAMDLTLRALDAALEGGYDSFLISSGLIVPEEEKAKAFDSLSRSVEEIFAAAGPSVDILLEPCDTTVDARQLLGPTVESVEFAEMVRRNHDRFWLTLDASHIAQLGEDFDEALAAGLKVSNHVHLASCILKQGHPLYGDKHPLFDNPDGVYTSEGLKGVMEHTLSSFGDRDCTIGVEIIDRSGKRLGSLVEGIAESPWFF